jgi:hypothetical protein
MLVVGHLQPGWTDQENSDRGMKMCQWRESEWRMDAHYSLVNCNLTPALNADPLA